MGALPNIKVRVTVRDDNDPDFDVPVQVHCAQCPGWALLQQFLIGYGYVCQMCSQPIPIIVARPEITQTAPDTGFMHGPMPELPDKWSDVSGESAAGQ